MKKTTKNRKNTQRAAIVVLGIGLVAGGAGAAFSYWTTPGSGTGSAKAGDVLAVTIKATSPAVTGLYPGGPAQSITGNFDNPNTGKVYIHQVSVAISGITNGASNNTLPVCTAADFTVTQPAVTNTEINPGNAVGTWGTAAISMTDSATDQGNCKNTTVQLAYTSN